LESVASHIARLPGVETREYRPGELLHPAERLRQLHICIRKGAVGLHVAVGRATDAILEVFGPGWLLSPPLWESKPTPETRHAAALLPTTTLEVGADAFGRHLAADPSLAVAVASWSANRLDVVGEGVDQQLWHKWWDGNHWNGWEALGGQTNSDPGATSWGPGRLDLRPDPVRDSRRQPDRQRY